MERSYNVISLKNGFKIISLKNSFTFKIEYTINEFGNWNTVKVGCNRSTYMGYDLYQIISSVVDDIYRQWKSPKETARYVPKKLWKWMKNKTAKSLNPFIYAEWKRVLDNIDPKINKLQKRLFSISCGRGNPSSIEVLLGLNNPYLVEDVMRFRAAAISLLYGEEFRSETEDINWMRDFSIEEKPYRSLRKTLMNLPGGILNSQLVDLKFFKLPEPATTRLKLTAYLLRYGTPSFFPNGISSVDVLLRSTENDIKNAVEYMWHYFPSPKSGDFRSIQEVIRSLRLIFDYPENISNIDIMGLARRSELYHHNLEVQRRIQEEIRLKSEQQLFESKTMLPPIPLPSNPNIKFLDTYKSVVDEGEKMEHCVATYAKGAVLGHSYLFHVEHNGIPATVEVKPSGYVSQSYGERDTINETSEYAKRELNKWAKGLIEKSERTPCKI